MVIVAPDGTLNGRASLIMTGSGYMNARRGRFADYIVCDVYDFATRNFCIRPERGAHILAGASMGGLGAYNLGFKNPQKFGVLLGILPPLDIRYADCHDHYMADYDPNCHSYRERMRPNRIVGRFYTFIPVRERRLTDATVGRWNPNGMAFFAANNPVELLDSLDIRPGQFEMFIGYSKKDEFNLDAHVEHFVDVAARRGIRPAVVVLPDGTHDTRSGLRLLPAIGPWVSGKLAPYVPPGYRPVGGASCTELLTARPRLGMFHRPESPPVWLQTDDAASPTLCPGDTKPVIR
jgi:hypothetical protein